MNIYLHNVAKIKMLYGEMKYGNFDPSVDCRDMIVEAQSELVDTWNYLRMSRQQRGFTLIHYFITYLAQGITWVLYAIIGTIKIK